MGKTKCQIKKCFFLCQNVRGNNFLKAISLQIIAFNQLLLICVKCHDFLGKIVKWFPVAFSAVGIQIWPLKYRILWEIAHGFLVCKNKHGVKTNMCLRFLFLKFLLLLFLFRLFLSILVCVEIKPLGVSPAWRGQAVYRVGGDTSLT